MQGRTITTFTKQDMTGARSAETSPSRQLIVKGNMLA